MTGHSSTHDEHTPVALVTGATQLSYGMIRSLGEAGVDVVVASPQREAACFSRYVKHHLQTPDGGPTAATREALLAFARARSAPTVLLPHTEQWIQAIAADRHRFAEAFALPWPDSADLELALSKVRMDHFCREHEIPTPLTRIFNRGDAWGAFVEQLTQHLPVVVKPETKTPQTQGFSLDVKHFETASALRRWAEQYPPDGPPFNLVAQQYIPGPTSELVAFHGYKAADGTLYMAGLTKLRTYPPHCGSATTAARFSAPPTPALLARKLLQRLPYAGLFDVEFKRAPDDDGDRWYFIEMNPRCGLPNYGATAAGVNQPLLAFQEALRRPLPQPCCITQTCVAWTDFGSDLLSLRAEGRSLARALVAHRVSLRGHRVVRTCANRRDASVIATHIKGKLRPYLGPLVRVVKQCRCPAADSRPSSDVARTQTPAANVGRTRTPSPSVPEATTAGARTGATHSAN